jgi:hypothetical protein
MSRNLGEETPKSCYTEYKIRYIISYIFVYLSGMSVPKRETGSSNV